MATKCEGEIVGELNAERILSLEPVDYSSHRFHSGSRDWIESNCYIDVYIEVLHALGLEVEACLGFTLSSDFEGDQWTFFKPPLTDLRTLYGIDVQELTLWRRLEDQIAEQNSRGNLISVEVDAFYLPDVAATDYRNAHVKTTIAVTRIDASNKHLRYFHNTGFYELGGEDFDGIFSLGKIRPDDYLPPYCELLKLANLHIRPQAELRELSLNLARAHFAARPAENPFSAYAARLSKDIEWLLEKDSATYHAYVFVTLRQCGANFEFASFYLRWLSRAEGSDFLLASDEFQKISQVCKMLVLKLARISRSKKAQDLTSSIEEMAQAWERANSHLRKELASER